MERAQHLLSFKETPRERNGNSQRTPYRQGYYSLIKTLVRFERWDLILDAGTVPVYDKPEQHAWRTWAVGLAYAAQGKLDEARTAHEQMNEPRQISNGGEAAARRSRRWSSMPRSRRAPETRCAATASSAPRLTWKLQLIYTEPPSYPRPVVEGFGTTAAALGDHGIAEKAFREALAREPGSGRAYFALASTLRALNRARRSAPKGSSPKGGCKAWNKRRC